MAEIIVNPAEATTPISVVCGNANAEVIRFTFPRNSEGVDLGECTWAVTAKNSGGFSDTYMQGHGMSAPTVTNNSISVKWTLSGVAVGTAGRTIYQLIGIQGKAIIKQFPYHTINVLSYLESSLSTEAEEDMSALWETIDYVGNELPEILEAEADREVAEAARASAETARAAAETARAAAEEARAAAEEAREIAFDRIDLKVSKTGNTTTVTATNTQGETTTSQVKDGEDGDGAGDMRKNTYDTDNDGIVELADRAANMPQPSPTDAGKAIVVNASGAFALGEAGAADAVRYSAQTLTSGQKTQARTNIGAAASAHTQAASTITAGTFAGQTNANAGAAATLGTAQVRDIVISTTDLTAGSSALATGRVYLVYE